MALFRQVALEVGVRLGYIYPHDLDRRVTNYVNEMQDRHGTKVQKP
jgi:hypothetical protein